MGLTRPDRLDFGLVSLLFWASVSSATLRSGEFVPLYADTGALACPQSLTAGQHFGDLVNIAPLGAAVVDSIEAECDVFVQCEAQRNGPFPERGGKWGESFLFRYPFLSRDPSSQAPVFGAPVPLPQEGILPGNISLAQLEMKSVWGYNGKVFLAALSHDLLHVLQLKNGTSFVHQYSQHFTLPAAWGNISAVAVQPHEPQSNGSWPLTIFVAVQTGNSTRARGEFESHPDWRSNSYRPYDGAGIYRGTMHEYGVAAFDVVLGTKSAIASPNFRFITPTRWSGGLMGLRLTMGGLDTLIAASRTGLVYAIPVGTGAHSDLAASVMPSVAVDNTTDLLFMARVISASPLAYPRARNIADQLVHSKREGAHANTMSQGFGADLIIGGENILHFTRVVSDGASASAISGVHAQQMQLRLHHAGPVLQRGATLVTGQTPTVSAADFNGDGYPDLVAGTSEGRILVALGTPFGFDRPRPLVVGEGLDAAEILVQGSYRTDIQGPSESRWGYTAPCAFDWNGDGLVDIISSDNSALTKVYMRYRTRGGIVALRRGIALRLDGLDLHGTWRNGPAAALVGDQVALVTSDEQDEAHLYWRLDNQNLLDGGKLRYREATTGTLLPIQTNYLAAGGSGRLKYSLVDWNGDGLLDLLLGTCGYHSIPSNITGLPACAAPAALGGTAADSQAACADNGATVLLMRHWNNKTNTQTTNSTPMPTWVFEWPEWVTVRGKRLSFGGQEAGVSPFDNGDGKVSLIVATPGGRHIFLDAEDLGTSVSEPPVW